MHLNSSSEDLAQHQEKLALHLQIWASFWSQTLLA